MTLVDTTPLLSPVLVLVQVMDGVGNPVTLHSNDAMLHSSTVVLSGCVTTSSGTALDKRCDVVMCSKYKNVYSMCIACDLGHSSYPTKQMELGSG